MRGRGSSFVLWLMGALLLWAGVAQIEHAGLGALVVLIPGSLMFVMGAKALYPRRNVVDVQMKAAQPSAQIIPFPGMSR
jgi:hypothetical protein